MSRITELYENIFDENGNIKVCGRYICKELITELNRKYPGIDFGNIYTGFLNIENVKAYVGKEK